MGDHLSCSECGTEYESTEELEAKEVDVIEKEDEGSFSLYGSTDLYLCKGCRKAMGVGHSRKAK